MGVIDAWRKAPAPGPGLGRLVLVCGPKVALSLANADPGGQLVPAAGPGSYRLVQVSVGGAAWSWRLLEDGEPVAHGTLAGPEAGGD